MEMEKTEILKSHWNGKINSDWAGWLKITDRIKAQSKVNQEFLAGVLKIFMILVDRNKIEKKAI